MYRLFASLTALATLAVCGCGSGHDYGPTGTAQGRLTHQGQPLSPDTKVVFMHADNGVAAFGATDAEGNFKVSTVRSDEIPVGTYRVMIQPPESELGSEEEPTPEQLLDDPNINRPRENDGAFDFKYRQVSTSGLQYDVKEGDNEFQIDLE